jgi:hypothetical protein
LISERITELNEANDKLLVKSDQEANEATSKLEILEEKHEELTTSYENRGNEIGRLEARIENDEAPDAAYDLAAMVQKSAAGAAQDKPVPPPGPSYSSPFSAGYVQTGAKTSATYTTPVFAGPSRPRLPDVAASAPSAPSISPTSLPAHYARGPLSPEVHEDEYEEEDDNNLGSLGVVPSADDWRMGLHGFPAATKPWSSRRTSRS